MRGMLCAEVEMKTTEEKSAIEIADHVKHIPSGEEWIVARVDDKYLWPCGWPESREMKKDCVLIKKSSQESRYKLIEELKKLPATEARHYYRHEQNNTQR